MERPRNGYALTVVILCVTIGTLSAVALTSALSDALSTHYVYLPRLTRGGPPARMAFWTETLVYMLALASWSAGGMTALASLFRRRLFEQMTIGAFALGAALFLVSWWHEGLVIGVGLLLLSFAHAVFVQKRRWVSVILAALGVAFLVYVAAP